MSDDRAGVFVNCPFDEQFEPLFDALIFTVLACGFRVRSALEADDGGELRLEKIYRLIDDCDYSIHDISRVELDKKHGLPRFNMPIELGIALGFKRFATRQAAHKLLVLDVEEYRYQKFASDLAGVDIRAHANSAEQAIAKARNFLAIDRPGLPSATHLALLFRAFEQSLPAIAKAQNQNIKELTFIDRLRHAEYFLAEAAK